MGLLPRARLGIGLRPFSFTGRPVWPYRRGHWKAPREEMRSYFRVPDSTCSPPGTGKLFVCSVIMQGHRQFYKPTASGAEGDSMRQRGEFCCCYEDLRDQMWKAAELEIQPTRDTAYGGFLGTSIWNGEASDPANEVAGHSR